MGLKGCGIVDTTGYKGVPAAAAAVTRYLLVVLLYYPSLINTGKNIIVRKGRGREGMQIN